MKFKKVFSKLLIGLLTVAFTVGLNSVYADTTTQTTPQLDLTVTANNEGNYNDLKWNMSDSSQSYSYRLYSKKSDETDCYNISHFSYSPRKFHAYLFGCRTSQKYR